MATVNAGKWGIGYGTQSTNFNSARTSNGTVSNQSTSSNTAALRATRAGGRAGTNYRMYRFFCAFDVSAYASGYTISGLSLKFRSTNSGTGGISGVPCVVLKSTAQGNADTDLAGSDFYSSVDYSTAYSNATGGVAWPDLSTDASIALNATAIADFSGSYLKLVVVQYANDYSNTAGGSDYSHYGYINLATGGTGYVPYLDFTATPTGYGNDVIGVSSANIDEVISVATANINEIIGA